MFLELIATFVAGIAAAGVIMLLNRVLRGRLPRWLMPVAAGAMMILNTVANEYGWYGRTSAALPDGIEIVETVEKKALYRPWTYVWPYVDRFAALDRFSVQSNAALPDQRLADMVFFGRWTQVQKMPVVVDCAKSLRAQLIDGVSFEEDGTIQGVQWFQAPENDPIVKAICEDR